MNEGGEDSKGSKGSEGSEDDGYVQCMVTRLLKWSELDPREWFKALLEKGKGGSSWRMRTRLVAILETELGLG